MYTYMRALIVHVNSIEIFYNFILMSASSERPEYSYGHINLLYFYVQVHVMSSIYFPIVWHTARNHYISSRVFIFQGLPLVCAMFSLKISMYTCTCNICS